MALEEELEDCRNKLKLLKEEQKKILVALESYSRENEDIKEEESIVFLNKAIHYLRLSIKKPLEF